HTRSKRDWSSDVCSSDLPVYDIGLMCGVERTEHVGDDGQRLVWGVPKFLVRFPQYLGGGFSRRVLGDRVDPITVTSVSQHWGEPWVGELGKGLGALQECVFCRMVAGEPWVHHGDCHSAVVDQVLGRVDRARASAADAPAECVAPV